jgi:hypothetical protein
LGGGRLVISPGNRGGAGEEREKRERERERERERGSQGLGWAVGEVEESELLYV